MKPEIKKQIILHLPYLAFIYLFGKVGQAFRLAQGADISAKLLHIGQGFSAAFASAAPSFHPTDLLIGLAAAVIIRLAVYSKQKNAKKYRKGMEYGTARWGIRQGRELQICRKDNQYENARKGFIIKNYGQQSMQKGLLPILLLIRQNQILWR